MTYSKQRINNSKIKIEQFKIGAADNSKLKTQNSKLKIAHRATIQNSKFKTQNLKYGSTSKSIIER